MVQKTFKQIKAENNTIIGVNMCRIDNLLMYIKPYARSMSKNGYINLYYKFKDVCISTGYAPLCIIIDNVLAETYDAYAKKIIYDNNIFDVDKRILLNSMIEELINKTIK